MITMTCWSRNASMAGRLSSKSPPGLEEAPDLHLFSQDSSGYSGPTFSWVSPSPTLDHGYRCHLRHHQQYYLHEVKVLGLVYFLLLVLPVDLTSASPLSSKSSLSLETSTEKVSQDKIDCLIDQKKGFSNPSNVYQCPRIQRCCFEYAKPSCCGSKPVSLIL